MMTVVHVVNRFPVRSQQFLYNEIAELIRRGVHVAILVRNQANPEKASEYFPRSTPPSVVALKHPRRKRLFRAVLLTYDVLWLAFRRPLAVHSLLRLDRRDKAASKANIFRSARLLRSYCRHSRAVHCQFGGLGPHLLALRECGVFDTPVIVSYRGHDLSRDLPAFNSAEMDLLRRADASLPVCDFFRQQLVGRYGFPVDGTRVHYTPLDLGLFERTHTSAKNGGKAQSSSGVRLLSVGRLIEKKGFEYTLETMKSLVADDLGIHLTIIGDGPLRERIIELVQSFGLEYAVTVIPALPQDELVDYYRDTDVFVLHCVTDAAGELEGIPNVLKEAMACSLPVVSTSHAGIPELVQEGVNGFLVAERDTAEFARAIRRLAADPELRSRVGSAGRQTIETRFELGQLTDELIEFYEST